MLGWLMLGAQHMLIVGPNSAERKVLDEERSHIVDATHPIACATHSNCERSTQGPSALGLSEHPSHQPNKRAWTTIRLGPCTQDVQALDLLAKPNWHAALC